MKQVEVEEKEFRMKSYGKADLAMKYNPDLTISSAQKALKRWIDYNKELTAELEKTNYNKYRKIYTPKEVELIVKYLGEP